MGLVDLAYVNYGQRKVEDDVNYEESNVYQHVGLV